MKVLIVIPARYKSSRFPGKPLADILGKPMIQHVYEKAVQSRLACKTIVATDDLRIFHTVKSFGGNAIMTSSEHKTGTDRIIEVAEKISAEIFINVQGDEPLIRPEDIDILINRMIDDPACHITTLCHQVPTMEALNPNTVKLVRSATGKALYFSRSPIPFSREGAAPTYLKHVGVYGYRKTVLEKYKTLPFSELEYLEKLEQLRLIEAGYSIDVLETCQVGQGVDTPEDLEAVKQLLSNSDSYNSLNLNTLRN